METKNSPKKTSKMSVFSWCLYDWAHSAFPVIITTFVFSTYFTQKVAANPIIGTAQWGDAIAIAALLTALLSPLLGAVADNHGHRKPWLALFALMCIIGSALLWYAKPNPDYVHWTLFFVILGTMGLEIGMVFYNSMLPDLAPKDYIGRISGWAWGLGYFGGLSCLIIALYVFVEGSTPWLPLNHAQSEQIRICGPLVAVWFALFGWPVFVFVRDRPNTGLSLGHSMRRGLKQLLNTLAQLPKHRDILIFLIAHMLYIDGLNTLFAFGGIYAAGTFHMSFDQVIQFGIGMNVAAGIGAAGFAWLDDFKGSTLTIFISLIIMISSGIGLLIIHSQLLFWILGMVFSVCVGPVQSASRSLMARIVPKDITTEMFGLYAFSGKATAFLGPFILSMLILTFKSQRIAMSSVIALLFAGMIVLFFMRSNKKT